jgi:hypothetical protein
MDRVAALAMTGQAPQQQNARREGRAFDLS